MENDLQNVTLLEGRWDARCHSQSTQVVILNMDLQGGW
jgi:hypothetical protein